MTTYQRRLYRVPGALVDDLAAFLVATGALGCEIKHGGLEAWFALPADCGDGWIPDLSAWIGVELLEVEQVAEQDWLEPYRAASQPMTVGRIRVDPRDHLSLEPQPGSSFLDLHVPAENAFGTGSHESTRLMLLGLQRLQLGGLSVLDVGTGSGILSFAALRLGADWVVGFDLDAPSVVTAALNARRNRVAPHLLAGTVNALAGHAAFDLLLVNVLPERIFGDLPRLVRMLKPGGRLLSSGNLVSRREELLVSFQGHGLELEHEQVDGEWLSFLFERRP